MCGIFGYQADGNIQTKEIIKTLSHRGPDAASAYDNGQTGIGHTRLCIIDKAGGNQPMHKNNLTISYNGEVYNYKEIRSNLKKKGYKFTTKSDTEVVLQSYREWGSNCVKKFRGMFAFIIYHKKKNEFFIARDRLGQKPLVYSQNEKGFFCASEIQTILRCPGVSKKLNKKSIPLYLGLQYIPSPDTGFDDIKKLKPAHTMRVRDGEVVNKNQYWNYNYKKDTSISFNDAKKKVRNKVKEATKLRMRSDVPVGAFLSGGLDSSTTVAAMQEIQSDIRTFSIGFEYEKYTETKHAKKVAEHFGTNHTVFNVTSDLQDLLPELVQHYGEPYADASAVPTYFVSREATRDVTVALTGDGGDELFGGYNRYEAMVYREYLRQFPGIGFAGAGYQKIEPSELLHSVPFARKMRRYARATLFDLPYAYFTLMKYFTPTQQKQVLNNSDLFNTDAAIDYFRAAYDRVENPTSEVEATMGIDVKTYLPEDLLVKVDIASMMNSLETRSPFLDHELLELSAKLPIDYKIQYKNKKRILKEAFKNKLPDSIINRSKQGFGIPRNEWLRDDLYTFMLDTFSLDGTFDEIFDTKTIKKMAKQHKNKKRDWGKQLWALLMAKLWFQKFNVYS